MSSKYTPTTSAVRHRYAEFAYVAELEDAGEYHEEAAEFDRWLAAHDAEVWSKGVMAKSNSFSIFDADVLAKNPYVNKKSN